MNKQWSAFFTGTCNECVNRTDECGELALLLEAVSRSRCTAFLSLLWEDVFLLFRHALQERNALFELLDLGGKLEGSLLGTYFPEIMETQLEIKGWDVVISRTKGSFTCCAKTVPTRCVPTSGSNSVRPLVPWWRTSASLAKGRGAQRSRGDSCSNCHGAREGLHHHPLSLFISLSLYLSFFLFLSLSLPLSLTHTHTCTCNSPGSNDFEELDLQQQNRKKKRCVRKPQILSQNQPRRALTENWLCRSAG